MTTLEDIIRIATNAHDGQKDMIGNPAIQHVLTVGLMGQNELEQKVGFLHDIVEDTEITVEDLRADEVEEEVLEAVDLLTHREGISYEDYVKNIVASGNEIAIHVKLNDLRQNLGRAAESMLKLSGSGRQGEALFHQILDIAEIHGWAEQYILDALTPRPFSHFPVMYNPNSSNVC